MLRCNSLSGPLTPWLTLTKLPLSNEMVTSHGFYIDLIPTCWISQTLLKQGEEQRPRIFTLGEGGQVH